MEFKNIAQQLATRADDALCIDDLLSSIDQSREIRDAACPASMQSIAPLVMAVSDNSGSQLTANITDQLESAESHIMKLSQVVKEKDHAISELSRQSSDALEKVSEHLMHLAVPSANLAVPQAVRSKTSTNPQEMFSLTPREFVRPSKLYDQDLGEHAIWAGLDLHEIIQGLVDALAPLQTMMKSAPKSVWQPSKRCSKPPKMPVLARRVLAVETSLASLNPSVNIEMQTSWLSSVPARLESLESSFAAISEQFRSWVCSKHRVWASLEITKILLRANLPKGRQSRG